MPGPYPREFREDVVAVARSRESGVTIKQIATDFGISEATLQNWLRQADVEDGNRPGQTAADAAEARELKKRIRLLEQENEVLRRAAAYLASEPETRWLPKMTYPLVAELADAGIPVTVSCRVLKLARQPYYRWRNDPIRDADVLRAYRTNALHDAHHDDLTFGYRYLADEARRAGWRMSRRTAWKLCSQAAILSSAQRRRRGKGKKAGPPVFDDHVQRAFRADAPNRLWLTDITEHWTSEGKLYCCAIKDVFSNRIVSYSISNRMTAKLAVDALRNAVTRRGEVAGCILHADRGSQFRSRAMVRELRRHDMVGSMGRVGAAGDNAAMESFWSLLQTNVLNQQRWATRQELRLAIVVWIERKYHRQRAQDTLGGLTPIEFEAKLAEPLTLAA
ncbi:IS3 family transposase [Microbacterium betulae]|uniref:IS3 family transposase n=1 Tax=Microbacterium betulae TaxID=2981139 RepID=UPI003743E16D